MRLVLSVSAKVAIYCALVIVGIWIILRGGAAREGLGALVVVLAAWELVKLFALSLGFFHAKRAARHS